MPGPCCAHNAAAFSLNRCFQLLCLWVIPRVLNCLVFSMHDSPRGCLAFVGAGRTFTQSSVRHLVDLCPVSSRGGRSRGLVLTTGCEHRQRYGDTRGHPPRMERRPSGLSRGAQAQSSRRVAVPPDSAQSPREHAELVPALSIWGAGGDQQQRDVDRDDVCSRPAFLSNI